MKGESYKNVNAYFSQTKARNTTIKALHDILLLVMYIFYPIQLLTLAINEGIGSELFLKFTLIPLCTLILISVLRLIINAKRPYEVYDYTPAVNKNTLGQSFPSRHTVSAFIIAMSFWYIFPPLGIAAMVVSVLIALSRVLSGAHFIRDVLVAAGTSILIGWIVYFLMD